MEEEREVLSAVLAQQGNKSCLICENKNPTWAALPHGVCFCTSCAGDFRDLGVGICRVKSLLLDQLSRAEVLSCALGGNERFLEFFKEKSFGGRLTPAFFRGDRAKFYARKIEEEAHAHTGSIMDLFKNGRRPARAAHPSLHSFHTKPSPKTLSRLKIQESEEESEEKPLEEKSGRKEISNEAKREEEPREEKIIRKGLKKSTGPLTVMKGEDKKRLGLIKRVNEESPSTTPVHKKIVMGSEDIKNSCAEKPKAKGAELVKKMKKYASDGKKSLASFVNSKLQKK
jgi:Putative GTPase activating protein for Arf